MEIETIIYGSLQTSMEVQEYLFSLPSQQCRIGGVLLGQVLWSSHLHTFKRCTWYLSLCCFLPLSVTSIQSFVPLPTGHCLPFHPGNITNWVAAVSTCISHLPPWPLSVPQVQLPWLVPPPSSHSLMVTTLPVITSEISTENTPPSDHHLLSFQPTFSGFLGLLPWIFSPIGYLAACSHPWRVACCSQPRFYPATPLELSSPRLPRAI